MKNWPWYGNLILAAIIFGLFFLFYYKPKTAEFDKIHAERAKIDDEVKTLRAKKQQLDRIESELVDLNQRLKDLQQIIPDQKESGDILKKIQQLAYDSRLNIVKFTPKPEVVKEFHSEWLIPIETTGTYHNLGTFFDRLSRFSRLFTVENFTIRALNTQTEAATISATWTAKTYFFHEELPAPAPAKKGAKKPAKKPAAKTGGGK
ncbi:MAG: type 4a pilus biogenesis protein PilO [Candidatus Aminicenantes bacterium]|jgi:Tfp pilus assembly protein PilO|nr:type 4a pilus biogenesis protein PilO [Candidatus Aminicenantes bacterium]